MRLRGSFGGGRDMAVDLGTANTLVFIRGRGIVLFEPSVVAFSEETGKVHAVGAEARRMIGRTPASIRATRPLRHGVIADFEITEQMLRHFITKAGGGSRFAFARVVLCVPSGITDVERRAVDEATRSAGARSVYLIGEPMAAAIGANLPVAEAVARMGDDIGGRPHPGGGLPAGRGGGWGGGRPRRPGHRARRGRLPLARDRRAASARGRPPGTAGRVAADLRRRGRRPQPGRAGNPGAQRQGPASGQALARNQSPQAVECARTRELRSPEEERQTLRLRLFERYRSFGDALRAPDAEADVPLLGQVARDAQRLALVTRVRPEELDQLAPLRRRAPGAEAERRRHVPTTFAADAHAATSSSRSNPYPERGFLAHSAQV